jgi:hypothetical protein
MTYGTNTTNQTKVTGQNFSFNATGLLPNTLYHYRAYANNSVDYSLGADKTFTTLLAIPTVVTNEATGIMQNNATLQGTLTASGGENCTVRFEYGLNTSYGTNTTNQTKAAGQNFSFNATGLLTDTMYHYRAYANNTYGNSTGVDKTFTTAGNNPPNTPTDLGSIARQIAPSVTIYANATDPDNDAITIYFYNNATKAEIGHASGASGSNLSVSWTGFSQGTYYSFYARANDSRVWSANSSVCNFTTNSPPIITGLMTENQTDPNRITNFIPYFNWTYSDNNSDAQQKYQIKVGTTQNGSNLWDSGNVTSASNNVKYNGTALIRGTLYCVIVRAYD